MFGSRWRPMSSCWHVRASPARGRRSPSTRSLLCSPWTCPIIASRCFTSIWWGPCPSRKGTRTCSPSLTAIRGGWKRFPSLTSRPSPVPGPCFATGSPALVLPTPLSPIGAGSSPVSCGMSCPGPWGSLASSQPQSNGMIERQHHILKDRLIARACSAGDSSWMDHLPFVLLGLRISVRADSPCSPSDLLYGSSLRLPGDLFPGTSVPGPPLSDFAANLRSVIQRSSPMPVVHHGIPCSRVDDRLMGVSHVFLRVDSVWRPLVPPYEGPFPILERSQKTFVILKKGKPVTVTIDRLKPATFLPESGAVPTSRAAAARDIVPTPAPAPPGPRPRPVPLPVATVAPVPSLTTSSGRSSRPPRRYHA